MAFMIEFSPSIPGITRFSLFSEGKIPVTKIGLGIATIYRFNAAHLIAFRDFLDGNSRWDDLLVKHAAHVRLHRKKITAKSRRQAEEDYSERMGYWRENYETASGRAKKAEQEVRDLRKALEIVSCIKKEAA